MKLLVIGDTHFKVDNIQESEHFCLEVEKWLTVNPVDSIVLLGDILHYHEKLETFALNLAVKFITMCSSRSPTYCLVGNHDATSNTIYCASSHWMNVLSHVPNVTVVDKPTWLLNEKTTNEKILCCPYVSDGRFVESLNEFAAEWQQAQVIFAHQTFNGAKMGAIVASKVEEWKLEWPQVISGHLHDRQRPQANLYYTGSSQQLAFGEKEDKSLACVEVGQTVEWSEVFLDIKHRKIIHTTLDKLDSLRLVDPNTQYKIVIQDEENNIKAFKKTSKFLDLEKLQGVKSVQFKPKPTLGSEPQSRESSNDFVAQLMENILQSPLSDSYFRSYANSLLTNSLDYSDKDIVLEK